MNNHSRDGQHASYDSKPDCTPFLRRDPMHTLNRPKKTTAPKQFGQPWLFVLATGIY